MKFYTQGCREQYCQLPRIEDALCSLGHELTGDISEADVVYVNNAWFDNLIRPEVLKEISGVIVFNILDLAPHIPDFDIARLIKETSYADKITTISETVQKDIMNRMGRHADVIYQPIQQIHKTRVPAYPYKYLFSGRVRDPNKRTILGIQALMMLNCDMNTVLNTGTEYAGFGHYAGCVSPDVLNDIYNSVDYVIFPSKEEGIGLPMIEAMAAGAIPVVCNDLSTLKEFLPFPEYQDVNPDPASIFRFISSLEDSPERKASLQRRLSEHYQKNLAEKFSALGVANRLLKVVNPLVQSNIKNKRS